MKKQALELLGRQLQGSKEEKRKKKSKTLLNGE